MRIIIAGKGYGITEVEELLFANARALGEVEGYKGELDRLRADNGRLKICAAQHEAALRAEYIRGAKDALLEFANRLRADYGAVECGMAWYVLNALRTEVEKGEWPPKEASE